MQRYRTDKGESREYGLAACRQSSRISPPHLLKGKLHCRLPVLVGLFAVLLYAHTIRHGYNMDDIFVLSPVAEVSEGFSYLSFFSKSYFSTEVSQDFGYRPIVLLSFAVERALFGNQPAVSHTINVLLYGLLSGMLLVLLRRLFSKSQAWLATFSVLVFVTHPLHTEVVSSIKNRDELLAFLCFVGCFLLLLRYTQQGRWQGLVAGAVLVLLALLSKKSALGPLALLPFGLLINKSCPGPRYLLVCLVMGLLLPLFSPLGPRENFLLLTGCSILWAAGYLLWGEPAAKLKQPQTVVATLLTLLCVIGLLYPEQPILLLLVALFSLLVGRLWPQYLLLYDFLLLMVVMASGYFYWSEVLLLAAGSYSLLRLHSQAGVSSHISFSSRYLYISSFLLAMLLLLHSTSYGLVSFMQIGLLLCMASALRWKAARWALSALSLYLLPTAYTYNGSLSFLFALGGMGYVWISVLWQRRVQRVAAFLLAGSMGLALLVSSPEGSYRSLLAKSRQTASSLLLTQQAGRPLHPIENPLAEPHDLTTRAVAVLYTYGRYLKLHLLPYPLRAYYGYAEWTAGTPSSPWLWGWTLLHVALVWLIWWLRARWPLCSFALIFYLGCLFPFSNAFVLVAGGVGERLAFTSVLGFAIALAYAAEALSRYFGRKVIIGCVMLVLLYSVASYRRATYWKDKETLYVHDASLTPRSAKLQQLLADFYLSQARANPTYSSHYLQKAEEHMRQSLSVAEAPYMHWYSMGLIFQLQGKVKEAAAAYEETLRLSPKHSDALFNLASCQASNRQPKAAATTYERYLEAHPKSEAAYANLSFLYFKRGEYTQALEVSLKATQQLPEKAGSWLNLGRIYLARKDTLLAISSFQRAQKLSPKDKQLRYHLQKLQLAMHKKKSKRDQ